MSRTVDPSPQDTFQCLERHEFLTPGPAEALAGLLGVEIPDLEVDGLPLLWHWLYTLERPREEDLGPDGHPIRNTILTPPGQGRRRMWAGGQVRYLERLRVGREAKRISKVESVSEKEGRTGRLTFVAVRHQVEQDGRLVVDERQDIVYRGMLGTTRGDEHPETAEVAKLGPDDWFIEITPSLLFRYSALTYNAHRIHYDRTYATSVEGYPNVVTHGPLQAVAMVESARRSGLVAPGPHTFDYRLIAPLYAHEGLVVSAHATEDTVTTTAADVWGRPTARGSIAAA